LCAVRDRLQEFAAQVRPCFKFPGEGLCHHAFIAASVFAQQQAELFGFDDARRAPGVTVSQQCVGNVARHPFLVSKTVTDGVDHPRNAAEAMQSPARQIANVRNAAKRHQVMRANAMYGYAPDHDHIGAVVGKSVTERFSRVQVITA
jgi:hypothetical protein